MTIDGNPDFSQYPATLTLHFKSEAEKREFMGQLSDGWGENHVMLDWPWKTRPRRPDGGIDGFHEQQRFTVDVLEMEAE